MQREAQIIQRVLHAHKLAEVTVLPPPHSFQAAALNVYRLQRSGSVSVAQVAKVAPEIDEALTSVRHTKTQCRISTLPLRVEVPRRDARIVSIYETLPAIRQQVGGIMSGKLLTLVGESVQERHTAPYLLDLTSPNTPHVLIAGTTGSGKTNLLTSMLASLAALNDARRLSLVVLDPKGIDLHCLSGLPHLAGPVVRDAADCLPVLQSVIEEMDRRKRAGKTPQHRIVVAIDEVADLMDVAGDEVEFAIKRIMQLGRGLGIHVIAATQKPSAAQVGSIIKANFPVRLVGAVASTTDATVASGFGGTGAERLPGRGAFLLVKGGDVQSVQAYYADKDETAHRCQANARSSFIPAWQYGTGTAKRQPSVTPERVYQTTVPAYTPDIVPTEDDDCTTDALPFQPLDKYGERIVRELYRQHGSMNAVIRIVWPNRRKQRCIEYLKPTIERINT